MRSHEERVTETKRRIAKIEREKRRRRNTVTMASAVAACLALLIGASLAMPGIAAGTILVFISSLGMFVVPDVMGGAKSALIGNLIQNQFLAARDWPFGSALSIVLAVMSLVLIILYYKALQSQEGGAKDAKDVA